MRKSRFSLIFFGVCWLASQTALAQVTHINNQELSQLLAQGVPVIDVRRAEEWTQTGVVEGSHLLTFFDKNGNYDFRKWMQTFQQIVPTPDAPFILICRTGNRTHTISQALDRQLGYSKVYNVKKGITHWKREKHPVVAPNAKPAAKETVGTLEK